MIVVEPDRALLERFYRGIYLDAFAAQHEPLEAWHAALGGDASYTLCVRVALDGDAIAGGIAYELYPESRCGFVTYLVVAPLVRERGLGRRLLDDAARALYRDGARAVFGEVNDPRVHGDSAWPRLLRFERWGARVVDVSYVQPSLGEGLVRDRGLRLIALSGGTPLPRSLPGELVRGFVRELHEVTERRPLDAEMQTLLDGIPDAANLVELRMVSPTYGHAHRDR